jgi:hypothetical protein
LVKCLLFQFSDEWELIDSLKPEPVQSVKVYEPGLKEGEIGIGHPIPMLSSKQQTTGEALYINDIPHCEG